MSEDDGPSEHKPTPSRRTLLKGAGMLGAAAFAGSPPIGAVAQAEDSAPLPKDGPSLQQAPNVLVILLDDVGFADFGCYGSQIRTPNIDRLAAGGLRYTNFRTTGVCSATRAALLTGLNHHSAGIGRLTDDDRGVPGYRGDLARDAATLAEALRAQGYLTGQIGKWHVNQAASSGETGPVYNWPLQRGFDRAYWFQGHSSDYFDPATLFDGNRPVERPNGDDYYLTDDLGDHAVEYIRTARSLSPEQPWFLYLAFNGPHSPLQSRAQDRDSYQGMYDAGWDVARAACFERQKQMGVVPAGAELPPLNPGVVAWDDLSARERRVCARYMEVYAGVVQRLDWNIGRILDTLELLGISDNTLIVLASDNGASAEGGAIGTPNMLGISNRLTLADAERFYEVMGERGTFPHYPTGWAMTCNTPYRLYKQLPHLGGVADPLVIRWPARIRDRGGIRRQFTHVVDVYPTILDAIGVKPMTGDAARPLKPLEGVSFAQSFASDPQPPPPRRQYFEINGHRAMYVDGWRIVTRHAPDTPFTEDRWQLFDTRSDINELNDLAAAHPEKVKRLAAEWQLAARRYNVLPLDDRPLLAKTFKAHWNKPPRGHLELFPPLARIAGDAAPPMHGRDHAITVHLSRDNIAEEGVLVAYGAMYFGWVFYIKDNRLVYESAAVPTRHRLVSKVVLPVGAITVSYRAIFSRRPFVGSGTLLINGNPVATTDYERAIFGVAYQGLEIGRNGACPVGAGYEAPFPFTGQISKVVLDYDTSQWTDAEIAEIGENRRLPV